MRHAPGRLRGWATIRRRWVTVAIVAVALTAGGSGAALAFVTVGGHGSSTVPVASPDDLLAVAGAATGLYPGGPGTSVAVTLTNHESLPLTVTGITTDVATLPAGCPAAAWDIRLPGPDVTVPAHGGRVVPVLVGLTTSAPSDCQGAHVSVGLEVKGRLG